MSSWFQRSPDPPRKKGLQRELSLEKQKPRHYPQLSPSLSARNSPTSESPKTPTGLSSGLASLAGLVKHRPLSATKSSPTGNSPSTPPNISPERNEEVSSKTDSSSANVEELLKEIQRLKENEVLMTKKLAMERQQKIMAEVTVEAERMALHEVEYRYYLREKSHRGHKVGGNSKSAGLKDYENGHDDFADAASAVSYSV